MWDSWAICARGPWTRAIFATLLQLAGRRGARARLQAGFDIVYVYAGMGYLPYEFLLPEYNHRTDAYGGPIENRVRFVREMIEVTREAVGGTAASPCESAWRNCAASPGRNADVRSA